MSEFKPEFLRADIRTVDDPSYPGRIADVQNLAQSAREKFPNGLVMKTVDYDGDMLEQTFPDQYRGAAMYDNLLNTCGGHTAGYFAELIQREKIDSAELKLRPNETVLERLEELEKAMRPESIAKAYQAREVFCSEYFKDLPGLVLPTQFVVGRDDSGEVKVFSFQEKVEIVVDLSLAAADSETTVGLIKGKFDAQSRLSIIEQVSLFQRRFQQLVEEQRKIIDIFGENNIVLTSGAQLKILDVGIFGEADLSDAEEYLVFLGEVVSELRA